jgi:hypothetical protein
MRRTLWQASFAILFVSLFASATQAASIPIRAGSSYGVAPNFYGTTTGTFSGGSFSESTFCPSNDSDGVDSCHLAYVFDLTLTPPLGATSLTIDFPTATSGVSLSVLFCDNPTTIPCGTLSGGAISGTLGPDAGSGQQFGFTDLSQLKGQTTALLFVDSAATPLLDPDTGAPLTVTPNIPSFTATYGTSSVATPEPACLALLGFGLAALGAKLRRKTF